MKSNHENRSAGQALVEFSLILVVLLLFIFIIVEAGRLFQGWLTVQSAARSGGRYALTGQFDTDCLTTFPYCLDARINSIKAETKRAATGLDIDPDALVTDPKSLTVEVWSVTDDGEWIPDYAGGPNKPVRVRVAYRMPLITPILKPIVNSVRLMGQVVVNTENYEQISSSQAPNAAPNIDDIDENPTGSGLPEADLAIVKSASVTERVVDGDFQYYLDVTNLGPFHADTIVVVDTLPPGVSDVVGTVTGGGFCDPVSGGTLTCYLPNLSGDGSFSNQARVTVDLKAPSAIPNPPQIVNSATVSAGPSTLDPDPLNNSSSVSVTVLPRRADVAITKSSDLLAVKNNDTFVYFLNVVNNGPDPVDGVVISDTLPSEVRWTNQPIPGCSVSGQLVTCSDISMGVGGVGQTFTIPVRAMDDPQVEVVNWAEIAASNLPDPDSSNNQDSTTVTIATDVADLSVIKTGPDTVVALNEPYVYDITVRNDASADDDGAVVITDTLSPDVVVDWGNSDGRCFDAGSGQVRCDLGGLDDGDQTTVQLVVTPLSAGILPNTVVVAGEELDSDLSNNSDSITTEVAGTDLAIDKAGEQIILGGQTITYTLSITNNGPGVATNVQVVDLLPEDLTNVQVFSNGTCQTSAGNVHCGLGTLDAGASDSLLISGVAPAVDFIVNEASVYEVDTDGNPLPDIDGSNNTDIITQTTSALADLEIFKFAIPDFSETESRSHARLEYLLQVTNKGPFIAENVVVTDTLPADVIFESTGSLCGQPDINNVFNCSLGDLIPGPTINITMAVTTTLPGQITNTAYVGALTGDSDLSDNDDSVGLTVLPADLAVKKIAPQGVLITESITYTLFITNYGPSMATNVILTDSLPYPDHVSLPTIYTPQGSCDATANPVVCNLGTIDYNTTVTVTMVVMPRLEGRADNFVAVGAPETIGTDLSDDQDQASTVIVPIADIGITKSASGSFYAGEALTYTLIVTNAGPSTAYNVEVVDILPPNVLSVTASADLGGNCADVNNSSVTCLLDDLLVGDEWTITLNMVTDADGDFVNNASVTGSILDLQPANNDVAISNYIIPNADLEIFKSLEPSSLLVRGQPVVYTVQVVNHGPSNATGVEIFDLFEPDGVDPVSSPDNPPCDTVAGQSITCHIGNLARDESTSVTIVALPNFEGDLTNTAEVLNTVEADRTPGNNQVVVTNYVNRSANLVVDKYDDNSFAIAGTTYQYALEVTNLGPSVATGGLLTDTLPGGWTLDSWSGGLCGPVGRRIFTCTLTADLAVNNSQTFVISATVPVDVISGTTVINNVTVTGLDYDPDSSNNDSESTTVIRHANLVIDKSDDNSLAVAGTTYEYDLQVTNLDGPSNSTGHVITDTLPFGWTLDSAVGATCLPIGGNVFSCDVNQELAIGDSHTVNVTVMVPSSAISGTTARNSAEVTAYDFDPDPANSDSELTNIIREAFLTIDKADDGSAAIAGRTYTYTFEVNNAGPSDSSGGTFWDELPSGWTYASDSGSRCSPVVTPVVGFACTVGLLTSGQSEFFTVIVNVPVTAVPGSVQNSVTVRGDDTNNGDSDVEGTDVLRIVDLEVTIEDLTDPVAAGTSFQYVVTASNNGPSEAPSARVDIDLPGAWSRVAVTGANCPAGDLNQFSCNVATIAVSGSRTFTLTVMVPADALTGTIDSTATIFAINGIDPVSNNDDASEQTTIYRAADLTIDKQGEAATATAGTLFSYDLTVTNSGGPSVSTRHTITDTLPTNWALINWSGGNCGPAGAQQFSCSVDLELAVDASHTVVITASVPASEIDGAVVQNSARVTGFDIDPVNNNLDIELTNIVRDGVLTIDKSDDGSLAVGGRPYTYTFAVHNNGPSDSASGFFTDNLPAGWTFSHDLDGKCDNDPLDFTCDVGPLTVGQDEFFTVVVNVPATAPGGQVINEATVRGDETTTENSDSEPTFVVRYVDLTVAKSDNGQRATAGLPFTYVITATNNGPSAANGGMVTDTLPDRWTFVSDVDGKCGAPGDNVFTCAIDNGLMGDQLFQVTVNVPANQAAGTVINSVDIGTDPSDTDLVNTNNSDSDTTDVVRRADLVVDKSDDGTDATAGSTYTYTIDLTNNGPSYSTGGTLTDWLPTGWTLAGGDCGPLDANVFTCPVPAEQAVGAAGTASFSVIVNVPSSVADGVTLTNTVQALGFDSTTVSNDSEPTTVIRDAFLTIDKSDDNSLAVAGTTYSYYFEVNNTGPSDSSGGTFEDELPGRWTYASDSGNRCQSIVDPFAGFACDVSPLTVGQSEFFTVTVNIPVTAAPGPVQNVVTVYGNDSSNSDSDLEDTFVQRVVDLAVAIVDLADPVPAGTAFQYVITTTNSGPSEAPSARVEIDLPGSWSRIGLADGAFCPAGDLNQFYCNVASMGIGGSRVFTLTVLVPSNSLPGTYTTTARISPINGVDPIDSNPASEQTTIFRAANLTLDKQGRGLTAVAGTHYSYDLTVTNSGGPSVSTGYSINDLLPLGWTLDSWSGGACGPAGARQITCTVGSELAVGASHTVVITASVPASALHGSIVRNSAEVFGQDVDPVDINAAAASTTVVRDGVLSIDKADDGSPAVAGQTYTYTFTVNNLGPSNSAGGSFTDTLPSGWTFSHDLDGNCDNDPPDFACDVGPLTVGQGESFTVVVNVPDLASAGQVTNTVRVQGNQTTTRNNDSETTDVVRYVDLTVIKSDQEQTAVAGLPFTYIITATNNGPSAANGGSVTDMLPANWSFISDVDNKCSSSGGSMFTCAVDSGLLGSQRFEVSVSVPTDQAADTETNNVNIAVISGDVDTVPNNSASDTTQVIREVKLDIVKNVSAGPWYVGEQLTYTVNVTNDGPSLASSVVVTDLLPLGISYQNLSYGSPDGSCSEAAGVISCTITDLDYQDSATVVVSLVPTTVGVADNSAYVRSAEIVGPSLFSSVSPAVLPSTDLQIFKTGPTVSTVNEILTYTLVVTNSGPLVAANVSISDTFPVTLTLPSALSSRIGDLCLTSIGPGATVVTCLLADLAADEVVTITITTVPTATGSVVNTASLNYTADPIHDPDVSNNSSSFGTDIVSSFSMLPDPLLTAFIRFFSTYQGDS